MCHTWAHVAAADIGGGVDKVGENCDFDVGTVEENEEEKRGRNNKKIDDERRKNEWERNDRKMNKNILMTLLKFRSNMLYPKK